MTGVKCQVENDGWLIFTSPSIHFFFLPPQLLAMLFLRHHFAVADDGGEEEEAGYLVSLPTMCMDVDMCIHTCIHIKNDTTLKDNTMTHLYPAYDMNSHMCIFSLFLFYIYRETHISTCTSSKTDINK